MLAAAMALALGAEGRAPNSCTWATASDVSGLRVKVGQDETTETPSPTRYDPEPDAFQHMFMLEVTREAEGPRCLLVGWRAVPRGDTTASADDFFGEQWPSGTIELPAWPKTPGLEPPFRENPPEVQIRFSPRDDGVAEPNETFGVELLDQNGTVIWGSEMWSPWITDRLVLWQNDEHRGGVVLTIHDAGHECRAPEPGSGFAIVNRREDVQDRPHYAWPGLVVERPDRPITQCEVMMWRIAPGGARPLLASDFPAGVFPSGTVRFNSFANGDPEATEYSLPLQFAVGRGVSSVGRTVKVIVESDHGLVAERIVTLD